MSNKKYLTIDEASKATNLSYNQLRYIEKCDKNIHVTKIRGRRYYSQTMINNIISAIKNTNIIKKFTSKNSNNNIVNNAVSVTKNGNVTNINNNQIDIKDKVNAKNHKQTDLQSQQILLQINQLINKFNDLARYIENN